MTPGNSSAVSDATPSTSTSMIRQFDPDRIIQNQEIRPLLRLFLTGTLNLELLEFVDAVAQFRDNVISVSSAAAGDAHSKKIVSEIVDKFVRIGAPSEINLNASTRNAILQNAAPLAPNGSVSSTATDTSSKIFDEAYKNVYFSLRNDLIPLFVRSKEFVAWFELQRRSGSVLTRSIAVDRIEHILNKIDFESQQVSRREIFELIEPLLRDHSDLTLAHAYGKPGKDLLHLYTTTRPLTNPKTLKLMFGQDAKVSKANIMLSKGVCYLPFDSALVLRALSSRQFFAASGTAYQVPLLKDYVARHLDEKGEDRLATVVVRGTINMPMLSKREVVFSVFGTRLVSDPEQIVFVYKSCVDHDMPASSDKSVRMWCLSANVLFHAGDSLTRLEQINLYNAGGWLRKSTNNSLFMQKLLESKVKALRSWMLKHLPSNFDDQDFLRVFHSLQDNTGDLAVPSSLSTT